MSFSTAFIKDTLRDIRQEQLVQRALLQSIIDGFNKIVDTRKKLTPTEALVLARQAKAEKNKVK